METERHNGPANIELSERDECERRKMINYYNFIISLKPSPSLSLFLGMWVAMCMFIALKLV